ncbi:DUF2336 domain-containing protein [Roseibium sp. TrichSKD4]|uniref:DUF2336 domain-containing protein n=1 Tax=Roseibium sp. TrichSKD4 TaxID=744980 RepID=UPI001AD8EDD7|nr:DUF2336 domain-containing protein [Roseibium sp. TrichSKD4]
MSQKELLIELAKSDSTAARASLLKKLVREFIEQTEISTSETEIESFSFIVLKFIEDLSFQDQIWLASRLCRTNRITQQLLERLLEINHEIKEALVEFSPVLNEKRLRALAFGTHEKTLEALARRSHLPEPVTERLIRTGHRIVVLTLLNNMDSSFSESAVLGVLLMANVEEPVLGAIANRALNDKQFRATLAGLMNTGCPLISADLRAALQRNDLNSLRAFATEKTYPVSFEFEGRILSFQEAHVLSSDEDLSFDALLLALFEQKKMMAAIWLISRRACLPEKTVENVLRSPAESAVVNLMKSTGISAKTFQTFLNERGQWLKRRPKFYYMELQKFRNTPQALAS